MKQLKSESVLRDMQNLFLKYQLSPNQFYLLTCIKDQLGPININIDQEIRQLELNNWIKPVNKGYQLEPKSMTLIQQVESFVIIHKKKTDKHIMGEDFEVYCEKFRQIFPKMLSPTSGKPLRTNLKSVIEGLRWFMENYDYTWEDIFKATYQYVDHFETKKYHYMATCQYFIRKQNVNRIWESILADHCANIEDGDDPEPVFFPTNVI